MKDGVRFLERNRKKTDKKWKSDFNDNFKIKFNFLFIWTFHYSNKIFKYKFNYTFFYYKVIF